MIHAISSNHASTIEGATSVKVKLPDAAVDLKKIEQVQVPKPSPAKFDPEKLANMSMREAGCLKRTIFQAVNSISVANEARSIRSIVKLCKKEFEKLGLDIRSKDLEYIVGALKKNRMSGSAKRDSSYEIMIRDKINEIISKLLNQKKSVESSPSASRTASIQKDIITAGMETEVKALSLVWEFPIKLTDDFNSVLKTLKSTPRDRKNNPQLSDISNIIYVNNKSKDGKENIELLVVGANKLYNKIKISGDKISLYDNNGKRITDRKINKEIAADIRAFLDGSKSIDQSKLSRSIMESVKLPMIDVRVDYGAVLGDIYLKTRNVGQDSYADHKLHIADVTVDHKTVETKGDKGSKGKEWGRSSIPEFVTRAAKSLPHQMDGNDGKIREQSMNAVIDALQSNKKGKIESVRDVGARFNIRNNWQIVDTKTPDTLKDIHCIQEGESIQFKTDKVLKKKQTIFQLQHSQGDDLTINISINLRKARDKAKDGFCTFETSINVVKCENSDISTLARDIKNKEKQLNQLVSKTIAEQIITDGNGKILPINMGALVKELDDHWTSDHPVMIWEGNTASNKLLMQRLDDKYIEGKTPMYTQMTLGARNKDFHYSVIIPKLKNELKLQSQKFEDAQLNSPEIRGGNKLKRYAADGKHSDRLCKNIISNKHFQAGFNEYRVSVGKLPKDFNARDVNNNRVVKCNDLKGAMNMLVHQFVSAQTRVVSGQDSGYKNTNVFLMKSTLREMMKENMRTEEANGLENYFEKEPKKFVQAFISCINARLKEITDDGDTVACFPLAAETPWNIRFYKDADFRSPSIEDVLDYTLSKDDYRDEYSYQVSTDATAVSNIASEFSGKNDGAASNSMMRTGEEGQVKDYTKLGHRTIVELRSPTINSESTPYWFSDEFLNRGA